LSCCPIEEISPAPGTSQTFRRGAPIVTEGDHTDTVLVLLRGRVKVSLDTADRREAAIQ
jgi:hypothetical protein